MEKRILGAPRTLNQPNNCSLIHNQGTAYCVACGRSSLQSMADTPSVVTPCHLASDTLLKAGEGV